eukprot:748923-Hanusia_phi.AAC.1
MVGVRVRMRMTSRKHAVQADAGDDQRDRDPCHEGDALVVDEALHERRRERRYKRGEKKIGV